MDEDCSVDDEHKASAAQWIHRWEDVNEAAEAFSDVIYQLGVQHFEVVDAKKVQPVNAGVSGRSRRCAKELKTQARAARGAYRPMPLFGRRILNSANRRNKPRNAVAANSRPQQPGGGRSGQVRLHLPVLFSSTFILRASAYCNVLGTA
jgi:hypothetical protein